MDGKWKADGCTTVIRRQSPVEDPITGEAGGKPTELVTECSCTHLTMFLLALRQSQSSDPSCAADTHNWVLAGLYAAVLLLCLVQLLRFQSATHAISSVKKQRTAARSGCSCCFTALDRTSLQHLALALACVCQILVLTVRDALFTKAVSAKEGILVVPGAWSNPALSTRPYTKHPCPPSPTHTHTPAAVLALSLSSTHPFTRLLLLRTIHKQFNSLISTPSYHPSCFLIDLFCCRKHTWCFVILAHRLFNCLPVCTLCYIVCISFTCIF